MATPSTVLGSPLVILAGLVLMFRLVLPRVLIIVRMLLQVLVVNRLGALLHPLPQVPMKLVPPLLLVENGATSSKFLVSEALKFLMFRTLLTLL